MQSETIFSDRIISMELVSVELCQTLISLGITGNVAYQYRKGADFCIPFTYAFDTERIYEQMDQNAIATMGLTIIPAYRCSDMEKCFDGFNLKKSDRFVFQASTIHQNRTISVFSERMPDALALLLIAMLNCYPHLLPAFNYRIYKK